MKALSKWLLLGLGGTAVAYYIDVVSIPKRAMLDAVNYARGKGGLVLDAGAGTPMSSFKVLVAGNVPGSVIRCDVSAKSSVCTAESVCHCDVQRLPFKDGAFSSILCSHVLGFVADIDAAMNELLRCGDRLFIVLPKPWSPMSWVTWNAGDGNRVMSTYNVKRVAELAKGSPRINVY